MDVHRRINGEGSKRGGPYRPQPNRPRKVRRKTAFAVRRSWRAVVGSHHRCERARQVACGQGSRCNRFKRTTRSSSPETSLYGQRATTTMTPNVKFALVESNHIFAAAGSNRYSVVCAAAHAVGLSERTFSWLNRFRALLVRWERSDENHLALLHLACGFIAYQQAGR